MNFEDALKQLKEGKKIRNPSFEKDEYLMGCYVGLPGENFEDVKSRGMSISWMSGEYRSTKMQPKFTRECESDLHIYPQLNLLLIMRDNWEAFE